ncbi:MAG: hypothetical protein JKX81_05860 [Arenicella sp.]|nr:hypothetical protein [Arenicella sp.]
MSKVGESIIQGAKEVLEFAQSDDNCCEVNAPDIDATEDQDSVSHTTERADD